MTEDDVDILAREAAYDGYFRIDRYRLKHRLFAGGWSPELVRETFERGHIVAVLPYDPVRDEIVLIEQFRIGAYAAGRWAAGRGPWLVEIVAGVIEAGETADAVARRETLEETGLEVAELLPVCRYLSSPGAASETVELYCARVDSAQAGGIHGQAGEGEDIRVFALPYAEMAERLAAGDFDNAMTLIGLHWLARNRDDLRRRWAARETAAIAILGIDHVVLRVRDLERAIAFYCDVLGCTVERRRDDIGLVHLRAGDAQIDLVPVDGELGRKGGPAPGADAHNMDHVALRMENFDATALGAHLRSHGVEPGEVATRFGATGDGPSMYIRDPDGNTVELKGPPAA